MKKIAFITGASGGIGSAIARKFAASGYAVVIQYCRNQKSADQLIASFPDHTDYLCMRCDLRNEADVQKMVSEVRGRFGTVSVLVNCAGIALPQKIFTETTNEEYDLVFDTNVRGMMLLTRCLYDDLRRNRGSIVNVSSMWGVSGASCEVLYSASKAAVIGFTKALAKELAPSDVTVNAVLSSADLESFRNETPLNKLGTPEDVAEAVFFLANARFITGQVLCCDGGYTL